MPPSSQPSFQPQWTCSYRRPKNPIEAQRLYNHARTVAYFLDATSAMIPGLDQSPVDFGFEAVIGAVLPFFGDMIGVALGLYFVFLAVLFGVPLVTVGWMILNLVLDGIVGVVPVIGDILDLLFKANLHNLALLESHLKTSRWAPILIIPDGAGRWRPRQRKDKPKMNMSAEDILNSGKGGLGGIAESIKKTTKSWIG